MSTNVITSKIKTLFHPNLLAETAATSTVAGAAESFVFTTKAADRGVLLMIANPQAGAGEITYSFSEGILGMPPACNDGAVNKIASGKTALIKLDSGFTMGADGKTILTVTPPAGKNLAALGVTIALIENDLTV